MFESIRIQWKCVILYFRSLKYLCVYLFIFKTYFINKISKKKTSFLIRWGWMFICFNNFDDNLIILFTQTNRLYGHNLLQQNNSNLFSYLIFSTKQTRRLWTFMFLAFVCNLKRDSVLSKGFCWVLASTLSECWAWIS